MNDILKGGFYRIPRFQRPYSWDRENVDDFWSDVIENSEGDYFIGSMVVYKPVGSDTSFVVDGQQRLTTVTMILAVLRNAYRSEGFSDLAAGVHGFIERKDISNQNQFSLQTETSYPYFQTQIQTELAEAEPHAIVGDEEQALKATYEYLTFKLTLDIRKLKRDRRVTEKDRKSRVATRLSAIRDKILALKVIYIDLDNEDDAYLIFETLNTRGKDLEPADLVKSYVTKYVRNTNKHVDTAKDAWNGMVATIEGSQADIDVTAFLHHYWLSRFGYVTAKNLYREVKRVVQKNSARAFLESLVHDAKLYRGIQETSFRQWDKAEWRIRESLDALMLFRVKQPLPMVLAVMNSYEAKTLKLSQVEDILGAIESFHFMFTAITSQRSSGGISFMYAASARDLFRAQTPQSRAYVLTKLKRKLQSKLPSFPEFHANFVRNYYWRYYTKNKKLIQYILARLDRLAGGGVSVDYPRMTIEHLMPQSRGRPTDYGNIGNLILCEGTFNAALGNKDFSEKKKLLQASKVSLDPFIETATDWTPKQIEEHATYMATRAFESVWKVL